MPRFLILCILLTANIFMSFATDCLPDAKGTVNCTDYMANATLNIDLRIANKHDSTINKLLFSTQDHNNRIYVRNVNHWTSGLDLTCISPYHSSPPVRQRAGTLITKRHVILAAHFSIAVGDSIRFITSDNVVVARKVIAQYANTIWSDFQPDVQILTLDSDVPPSITPCKFLPYNYTKYITNQGKGLPVLIIDQEEKGIVSEVEMVSTSVDVYSYFYLQQPTNPNRLALFEDIIGGDSGDPAFIILSGQLVLLGTFTWGWPGSGTSLTCMANLSDGWGVPLMSINDVIKNSDASIGINTGYKVSFFKFEGTSAVNEIQVSPVVIFAIGKQLHIKNESNKTGSVSVFDIMGRKIALYECDSNETTINMQRSGIYLVSVAIENKITIKKIFVR